MVASALKGSSADLGKSPTKSQARNSCVPMVASALKGSSADLGKLTSVLLA